MYNETMFITTAAILVITIVSSVHLHSESNKHTE